MVIVQFLPLLMLLLPKHHHALSSTRLLHRPSPVTPFSTSTRKINTCVFDHYNIDPLSRCNAISNYRQVKHHNGRAALSSSLQSSASVTSNDSSVDVDDNSNISSSETPLSVAMAVGIVTSLIGYLYSKCMKTGFNLLWKTIPSALFNGSNSISSWKLVRLLNQYPAAYIILVMTLGGGAVATLSTFYFPNLFNAHDYVHILSKEDGASMDKFPPQAKHLLPVLLLSCLTSISGFSLGPEAPMVTAGGLVGVSLARKYLQSPSQNGRDKKSSASVEETLAYAGAAGTLTGFMNVPLAGPIFAMEMTSRRAGISPFAAKSWSAAMAASLAGLVFVRGGLTPNLNLGGHFTYGAKAAVGTLTGKDMVLASLICGVGGAIAGTCFHKAITFMKTLIWPVNKSSTTSKNQEKYVAIGKKVLVAAIIGIISVYYPQTMFWGEGSLQCVVDGQCTPFSATPHGIPTMMTTLARVPPNLPFASGMAALQVGVAKFMAIALATAGKFPGGVIFPLLSNGASLAHALISALRPMLPAASSSLVSPLMVMSFMASILTSITRTPLATVLILAFSASGMTQLSALLPGVLMASYVSCWVSDKISRDSFFSYE